MKKLLVILNVLLLPCFIMASDGYHIKLKIKNLHDTTVILAHHFGDKMYVDDTLLLDNTGYGEIKGDKPLPGGLYVVYLPTRNYFDVIIDRDQDFYLENDTINFIENMVIKGSPENQIFYDYQKYMQQRYQKGIELQNKLKAGGVKPADSVAMQNEIDRLSKEMDDYKVEMLQKHPNELFLKMLRANIHPTPPPFPRDAQGNIIDSNFQYFYYRNHYFDSVDFADARLLRTPALQSRIDHFITKVMPQIPDTLIPQVDKILTLSQANIEVFQYCTSYLFNHFNKSNIVGMDAVFIHIADKYYLSGVATWADTSFMRKLKEQVVKMRPTLLGAIAPDINLLNEKVQWERLHEVKAPVTILVFWEPECGHCQKAIPELKKYYDTVRGKGVQVFAVCTQLKEKEWHEFIAKNNLDWHNCWDPYNSSNFRNLYNIYSTPTIFVLDKDKRIISKRIDVQQLDDIVKHIIK